MIPLSLPEPSRSQPRHFSWLCAALCILGTALLAQKVQKLSGLWTGPFQIEASLPITVSVGPARFQVPPNLIAASYQQRLSGTDSPRLSALRLALAWPDLTSAEGLFPLSGRKLILVDLDSNPGRESLRARLEPFYRRLARGGELAGPDGLKILTLSARGAPVTDLVAFDPAREDGFIARCRVEPQADTATCYRAQRIEAGLELRYRFDQSLLPDWRRLEAAVFDRIDRLRLPDAD